MTCIDKPGLFQGMDIRKQKSVTQTMRQSGFRQMQFPL
jgi:hypothetical protein